MLHHSYIQNLKQVIPPLNQERVRVKDRNERLSRAPTLGCEQSVRVPGRASKRMTKKNSLWLVTLLPFLSSTSSTPLIKMRLLEVYSDFSCSAGLEHDQAYIFLLVALKSSVGLSVQTLERGGEGCNVEYK